MFLYDFTYIKEYIYIYKHKFQENIELKKISIEKIWLRKKAYQFLYITII